jgi:uncharacterized membrane protein YhaH (DUF805 family)
MADAPDCYYLDGARNQQGPVAAAEIARLIRNGMIRRDTLIWYAGMPEWRPVSQVNDFASLFVQATPPRPPTAPPLPAGPPSLQRRAAMAAPFSDQAAQLQARQSGSSGRMGFGRAVATCFRKYVDFTGRGRRAEYWFFHLFYWLMLVVLISLDVVMAQLHGPPVFTVLAVFAMFLPILASTVRRLHDTDHSGWMIFISWIPLVGPIIFIVFMCQRGTKGENRFGPDPLGTDVLAAFE